MWEYCICVLYLGWWRDNNEGWARTALQKRLKPPLHQSNEHTLGHGGNMHRGFPCCADTTLFMSPLFSLSLSPGWKQLSSKTNCFCTVVLLATDQAGCCTSAFNLGWPVEVCTTSDLNISRLAEANLHLAQRLWSSWGFFMPSFLPGILNCLCWSDSKEFTGNLTACEETLTYHLSGCCMSVECAFWLPEEELDVHQDQTWEWCKVSELDYICLSYPS